MFFFILQKRKYRRDHTRAKEQRSLVVMHIYSSMWFWFDFTVMNDHNYNKYGLLTKCEVNMAGYWPSSFFCVFMDRDGVEVHELAKKRGQYPAILTELTWSIKGFIIWLSWKFFLWEQDSSIFPARVANHNAEFDSSCPLAELGI